MAKSSINPHGCKSSRNSGTHTKNGKAKIEEVQRGDFELPRVRDKALWSLFYNVWIPDKSGLEKFTRRGEGIMTWKLIYDEITKGKGDTALKYRVWLGSLYSKPRPKTVEESKAIFDEIEQKK